MSSPAPVAAPTTGAPAKAAPRTASPKKVPTTTAAGAATSPPASPSPKKAAAPAAASSEGAATAVGPKRPAPSPKKAAASGATSPTASPAKKLTKAPPETSGAEGTVIPAANTPSPAVKAKLPPKPKLPITSDSILTADPLPPFVPPVLPSTRAEVLASAVYPSPAPYPVPIYSLCHVRDVRDLPFDPTAPISSRTTSNVAAAAPIGTISVNRGTAEVTLNGGAEAAVKFSQVFVQRPLAAATGHDLKSGAAASVPAQAVPPATTDPALDTTANAALPTSIEATPARATTAAMPNNTIIAPSTNVHSDSKQICRVLLGGALAALDPAAAIRDAVLYSQQQRDFKIRLQKERLIGLQKEKVDAEVSAAKKKKEKETAAAAAAPPAATPTTKSRPGSPARAASKTTPATPSKPAADLPAEVPVPESEAASAVDPLSSLSLPSVWLEDPLLPQERPLLLAKNGAAPTHAIFVCDGDFSVSPIFATGGVGESVANANAANSASASSSTPNAQVGVLFTRAVEEFLSLYHRDLLDWVGPSTATTAANTTSTSATVATSDAPQSTNIDNIPREPACTFTVAIGEIASSATGHHGTEVTEFFSYSDGEEEQMQAHQSKRSESNYAYYNNGGKRHRQKQQSFMGNFGVASGGFQRLLDAERSFLFDSSDSASEEERSAEEGMEGGDSSSTSDSTSGGSTSDSSSGSESDDITPEGERRGTDNVFAFPHIDTKAGARAKRTATITKEDNPKIARNRNKSQSRLPAASERHLPKRGRSAPFTSQPSRSFAVVSKKAINTFKRRELVNPTPFGHRCYLRDVLESLPGHCDGYFAAKGGGAVPSAAVNSQYTAGTSHSEALSAQAAANAFGISNQQLRGLKNVALPPPTTASSAQVSSNPQLVETEYYTPENVLAAAAHTPNIHTLLKSYSTAGRDGMDEPPATLPLSDKQRGGSSKLLKDYGLTSGASSFAGPPGSFASPSAVPGVLIDSKPANTGATMAATSWIPNPIKGGLGVVTIIGGSGRNSMGPLTTTASTLPSSPAPSATTATLLSQPTPSAASTIPAPKAFITTVPHLTNAERLKNLYDEEAFEKEELAQMAAQQNIATASDKKKGKHAFAEVVLAAVAKERERSRSKSPKGGASASKDGAQNAGEPATDNEPYDPSDDEASDRLDEFGYLSTRYGSTNYRKLLAANSAALPLPFNTSADKKVMLRGKMPESVRQYIETAAEIFRIGVLEKSVLGVNEHQSSKFGNESAGFVLSLVLKKKKSVTLPAPPPTEVSAPPAKPPAPSAAGKLSKTVVKAPAPPPAPLPPATITVIKEVTIGELNVIVLMPNGTQQTMLAGNSAKGSTSDSNTSGISSGGITITAVAEAATSLDAYVRALKGEEPIATVPTIKAEEPTPTDGTDSGEVVAVAEVKDAPSISSSSALAVTNGGQVPSANPINAASYSSATFINSAFNSERTALMALLSNLYSATSTLAVPSGNEGTITLSSQHPIFGLRSVVVDIILSSCCMLVSSVGDRSEPTAANADSVEERKKDKKKPGDDAASAAKPSKDDPSPTPTTAEEGASPRERSSSKSPTRAKSILAAAITSGKIAAMAQEDKKLKSSASTGTSPPVVSSFALTIPHISIIAQVHNREAAKLNYSCENYETLETVMATLPSSLAGASTKDSAHSKRKEVAANVLRLAALPLLQVKEAALTLQVARSARSAISRLHPSILAYSATTVGKAAAEERAAAVARLISGYLFNPIAVASRKGMLYYQAPYSSSRMASNLTSANQSANSSFSGLPSFTSKPLSLLRSTIKSPTTSAASLAQKKASTTLSSKQQQQAVALFAPLLQFFSLDDLQQQLLTFDPMAILKRYNVSVVGGVSSAAAQHAVDLATVAVGHNGVLRRIETAAAATEAAKAPAATSKATASPATSPAAAPSGKMSPRQKWLADKKAKEEEEAAAASGDKDGDTANKDKATKAPSPPETVTSAIAALVDSLAIANSNPSASSKQRSSAQATAALAEAKRRLSDPLVASASLPPTTIGLFLSQFAALQEEVVLLREQVRAQAAGLAEAAAIASTSPAVTAAVLAQQQQVAKLKATVATTATAPTASVAGKAPASTPAGKVAATGSESPPAATSPSKATSPTKAAAGKKVAPSPPAASAGKKAPAAASDIVPDIVIDYAKLKVPPTPAEVTFGARAAELYAQNCSLGAQCTSQHLQLLSLQHNNERLSTMVNVLTAERGQREETMKALLSQLETAKGEVEEMRLLGRHRMSAFARSLFESKRAMATALAASKNTRHFGVGVGGLDAKKGHHISAAAKRKKEQAEFLQQLKAEEGKTWSGRRLRPHEQKMLLAPNNDDFPITLRNVSSSNAFNTTIDGKKVTSDTTATASAIVTWDSIERLAALLAAGGIPTIPSTAIGPVGSTATKITNRLTFFAAASAGSDNTLGADEYFSSTVPPASTNHPLHRQQPNASGSNSNGPTNSNTPAPTSRAPSTQSEGDLDWREGDTETATNKKATKDPKDKSEKREKRSSKDDKSSSNKEGTAEATTGRDKKVPEASPTASTSAATLQVGLLPTPQNTNIRPPPPSISVGSILHNLSASAAQQSKALSASEVVALMELKPTLSNYQTALFNFTIQRIESLAKRLEAELAKTNRVLTSVSGGTNGGGGGPDFSISIDRDLDGESLLFRERSEQALALRRGGLAALRSAQLNAKSGEYSALSASSAPTNNSHYDGRRNKHSAGDAMLTGIAGNKPTRRGLWRGEVKEVDAATDAATLLQQLQMQGAARGGDSALPQQPHSILKGTTAAQRAAVIVAEKESHWSSLPREDPRARRHRKQQQQLMSDSNSNPYDSEDSNLTDISNFSVDSTRYDVHGPLDGQPNDATDPFNFHLWYDLGWNHSDPYGSFFKILSALRRQAAERQRVLNEQLGDGGGGKGGFSAKYNAASSSSPLLFNSSVATAVPATTTTHSTRYDPSVKLSVITSFFDEYHRRFAEEILFGSERMDDCMLPQFSGGPRMLAFTDLAMLRKVALAVPIKPTSSSLEQMRRTAMESLLLLPENQDQKALSSNDGKILSTSDKASPKSSFKRALSFSYSPDTIAKAEAEAKKFEDDEAKFLAELEAEEEKERQDKKEQPSDELLQNDEPQVKTAESVANDSVSIVGTTRKSSIAVAGDTEFHPVPAYLRTASNARVVSGNEEKETSGDEDEAAHQAMRKKNDHHARIADTKSSSGSPIGRNSKATPSLADLSTLVRGGISHRRELVQRFSDMVNPMLPDEAVPRVTDVSVEGIACDGGLLVASFNASGAVRVNVRWLRQSIYNQLGQGGSGVGGFSAPELVKSDEDYSLQSYLFNNNAATATPPSAGGAIAISGSQGAQAKQSILTYSPTAEDVGCYIILEVTPISERFGTGMAVVARTAGPIIADTPSIPHGVLSFTPQGAAMLPRQPRSSVVITPSQNPTNKSCLVGDRLQVCFSVSGLPMDFTEQTSVSAAARSNAVNFNQEELLQEGMGSKVIVRWQRSSNNIDYTTFATEVLDLSTASANYRYFKDLLSGGLLPEDPHGNLNKRVVTTTSASPVGSPLFVEGSTANAPIGATDGAAFPSIFASLNASSAVNQPPIDSSLAASASGIGGFLKRKGALHTDPHAYNTLEHNQRTLTSYATALYQQQQQQLVHHHASPAASQQGATGGPQSAILSTSTSNVQTSSNVFMAFLFAGPELATCFVRAELVPVRGVDVSVKRIQQLTYLRSLEREKEKQLAKMQESSALAEIDGLAAGSFSIPKRVTRRIRFAEELIQVFSEEARTTNSSNNNVTASTASAGNYSGVYQGWSEASAAAGLSHSSFVGPSLCTTSVYINSAPTTEAVVLEMVAAGGWNGKLLSGPRSNVTTILAQEDTNSKVIDGKDAKESSKKLKAPSLTTPPKTPPPQPASPAGDTIKDPLPLSALSAKVVETAATKLRTAMRSSLVHVDVNASGLTVSFQDGTQVVAPWPNSASGKRKSSSSSSSTGISLLEAGLKIRSSELARDSGRANMPYYLHSTHLLSAPAQFVEGSATLAASSGSGGVTATTSADATNASIMVGPQLHIPPLFPVMAADATNNALYTYGTSPEAMLFDNSHTMVTGGSRQQHQQPLSGASIPLTSPLGNEFDTKVLSPLSWAYNPYSLTTLATAATIPPPPSCSDRASTNIFLILPPTSILVGSTSGIGRSSGSRSDSSKKRNASFAAPSRKSDKDGDGDDKNSAASAETDDRDKSPRSRSRSSPGGKERSSSPSSSSKRDAWSVLKNALIKKKPAGADSNGPPLSLYDQIAGLFDSQRCLSVEVVFNTRSDRDVFVTLFQCFSIIGSDRKCLERVLGQSVCSKVVYPTLSSMLTTDASRAGRTLSVGGLSNDSIISARSETPPLRSFDGGSSTANDEVKKVLEGVTVIEVTSNADSLEASRRSAAGGAVDPYGMLLDAYEAAADRVARVVAISPYMERPGCTYGLLTMLTDNRSRAIL